MEGRLINVQQKLEELTRRFEEERERIPREMEEKGKELMEMVQHFQKELAEERADRLSREGRILQQMDDHASSMTNAIENESTEREQIARELREHITGNERQRSQMEQELQLKVQKELMELKGMIERESKERKVEDDEIVMALNRYTQQLQSSLSVISS